MVVQLKGHGVKHAHETVRDLLHSVCHVRVLPRPSLSASFLHIGSSHIGLLRHRLIVYRLLLRFTRSAFCHIGFLLLVARLFVYRLFCISAFLHIGFLHIGFLFMVALKYFFPKRAFFKLFTINSPFIYMTAVNFQMIPQLLNCYDKHTNSSSSK
jgi:hypothetical protein